MSGYVEIFAHVYDKARDFLHSALVASDAERLGTIAMVYQALGEIAALEQDWDAVERNFSEIDSLCAKMGIQPRCIYIREMHWYTLPGDQFSAWSSYIGRHQ